MAILTAILLAGVMPSPVAAQTVIGGAIQHGEIVEWYEPNDSTGPGATGLGTVLRWTEDWTGDVYALQLLMTRRPTTTEPIRVEVRLGDPNGPLLGTSEPVVPDAVPVEPATAWVVFHFFVPLPVEPDVDYAIVLAPGADTGSAAAAYGWVSTEQVIGPEAEWVGDSAGWTHDGARPWTTDEPVTHRTALLAITLGLGCRVLFDDGFKWWEGGVTHVGEPLMFFLIDFIPASDVEVHLTHRDSGRTLMLEGTYGFGGVETVLPVHAFGPNDVGVWDVVGVQADGRSCTENPTSSTVDVLAAAVTPSPTPAPLPDTRVGADAPGAPSAGAGWLLLLAVSVLSSVRWAAGPPRASMIVRRPRPSRRS
jgi:hypothetical protein